MKTLTYYVAIAQYEHQSSSLRAKTRKALIKALQDAQAHYDETTREWYAPCNVLYSDIKKISIPYTDDFHLMQLCTELEFIEAGNLYAKD